MGKNDQYMHERQVARLETELEARNQYIEGLKAQIVSMEHDLATTDGLWVADREGAKATFRIIHASLHPELIEGTEEGTDGEEQSGESAVSTNDTV